MQTSIKTSRNPVSQELQGVSIGLSKINGLVSRDTGRGKFREVETAEGRQKAGAAGANGRNQGGKLSAILFSRHLVEKEKNGVSLGEILWMEKWHCVPREI